MLFYGGFKHRLAVVEKLHRWSRTTAALWNKFCQAPMGNSSSNALGIPPGKGPNQVGCTDLMVGHTVEGSFLRLYYPCVESPAGEMPCWIPSREYYDGLADFMKMNRSLGERVFRYLFGTYKIPATTDASFKPDGKKYPIIIFSHGLGAFRTLYSGICAELASQGFVVAAVEHRDESSSATFYFQEKAVSEEQNQQASKYNLPAGSNLEERWMYYRAMKTGESEFPLRNKQVKQRAEECIKALDILMEVNSGNPAANILQTQFDWTTLENSLDMCRTAIMGHSFGGATVIESLCKEHRFKCGIALDSWMFPLDEEIFPRVKQPILFINSEKFQWAGNIIRMRKLDSTTIPRRMITIRGTVHQSFPDFTFLTRHWIGKLLKLQGEIDPRVGLDLCNRASLAFFQRHLSLEKDFNQWDHLLDGQDENLIRGTNVNMHQSSL